MQNVDSYTIGMKYYPHTMYRYILYRLRVHRQIQELKSIYIVTFGTQEYIDRYIWNSIVHRQVHQELKSTQIGTFGTQEYIDRYIWNSIVHGYVHTLGTQVETQEYIIHLLCIGTYYTEEIIDR